MDAIRFGLGVRALRRRRRWTQAGLGRKAAVSRSVIGRIERGEADRVAVQTLIGIATELGARIDVRLMWHGEGLDRLLDARHAALVDATLGILAADSWEAATEVSFNLRGERGSVDILAFHPQTGCLLVVEVKSVVPDIQAMLVTLDRKGRLGGEIGAGRGWPATSVTRLLVVPDDRTTRRRVETLAKTFASALPARTVEIRRWLREPEGDRHGVLFLSNGQQAGTRHRVSRTAGSRCPI
jgi:transcriptional regulator with XRE-family HTH domain